MATLRNKIAIKDKNSSYSINNVCIDIDLFYFEKSWTSWTWRASLIDQGGLLKY